MSADTRIADRIEIAELFSRLANVLDEHRHDDIATVYAEDVVVHSPRGGELRGLEEVTAHLKRSQFADEQTLHQNTDVVVDLDGDRARATSNQLTYFSRGDEPPHETGAVRVSASAVRTPAGWRFDEMTIKVAWIRAEN
ncbi:nuclear transport factor 2 family protein [Streptomyces boninensis]|uniref:nuclear transport factor 2 family protein n=1 Tax=Streptomyces boninensis TaxID=2039455 RepID=UPI003B22651A